MDVVVNSEDYLGSADMDVDYDDPGVIVLLSGITASQQSRSGVGQNE